MVSDNASNPSSRRSSSEDLNALYNVLGDRSGYPTRQFTTRGWHQQMHLLGAAHEINEPSVRGGECYTAGTGGRGPVLGGECYTAGTGGRGPVLGGECYTAGTGGRGPVLGGACYTAGTGGRGPVLGGAFYSAGTGGRGAARH
ncbi:unnamed protein product [Zymoseptoria tritici ST99CH_3D7]|uniref:Uncharacterized protein n=1 Tax=Zymoseptoria tritici (strain ST99CH_3D7) TaxID=1276538 RepID=A0A1X7RYB3_ZYMT9|nr:unnamed protein product [Zymoseptoria tritici ST99CH_3D7]